MRLRNILVLTTVMAISVMISSAAYATSVTFNSLDSLFYNPTDGANIQYPNGTSYSDPTAITWGTNGTSGYNFDTKDTPFLGSIDTVFSLGVFTHTNQSIDTGTAISSVKLSIRSNLSFGATDLGEKFFEFLVTHDETPNTGGDCCDDSVTIKALNTSDTFTVGAAIYTLNILGFASSLEDAANGIYTSIFSSPEGGSNVRFLMASFSLVEGQDTPSPVPLPATLPLLLAGLGGIGILRRRKKT